MATSGNTTTQISSWLEMNFSWWQNEQSIANNTTTIGWKLDLNTSSASGLILYGKKWTVKIDGTEYSGYSDIELDKNDTQVIAEGTAVLNHNDDGSKPVFSFSFAIALNFTTSTSGTYMGTYSGQGSDSLPTIPRKSVFSVTDGTLGVPQTITVTKQANDFVHTITYQCGSLSGIICDKSSSTSVSWTPLLDFAAQAAATANSVEVVLTIITYNGNTEVGSASSRILYAIPNTDRFSPSVTYSISDDTNYSNTYGAFVQGLSKLKVIVNATGAYGAQISSISTEFEGASYTGAAIISNIIKGYGTIAIKITVTDSRGKVATANTSISVLQYEYPQIPALKAYRSDANGIASSSGAYIAIQFSSKVYSLNNKNTVGFTLKQRATGTASYTDINMNAYSGQYSVTNGLVIFAAEPTNSYEILFSVYDSFKTTTKYASGAPAAKVFSLLKSAGKIVAIAFGKIAETANCFDIGWPVRFSGGILQPTLKNNTDFNDVKTPNTYTLNNLSSAGYLNCPVSTSHTGTLTVNAVGESDTVHQIFQVASKSFPGRYERFYYGGAWGAWICKDSIIDQGINNGWIYRKWFSGIAECWKTVEHKTTVTNSNSWGAMYRGNPLPRQLYPDTFTFTSKPVEVASLTSATQQAMLLPEGNSDNAGENSLGATACYNVCCPTPVTAETTFCISFHVVGNYR